SVRVMLSALAPVAMAPTPAQTDSSNTSRRDLLIELSLPLSDRLSCSLAPWSELRSRKSSARERPAQAAIHRIIVAFPSCQRRRRPSGRLELRTIALHPVHSSDRCGAGRPTRQEFR